MNKRKLMQLATVLLLLISSITYGQAVLTEKGRPNTWATKVNATTLHNFYQVDDSVFRCEQPDELGFKELSKLGIKSVLDLRKKNSDSLALSKSSLLFFKVGMEAKQITDNEIIEALKTLKAAPKPIVVHCRFGADRTGLVMAMYRIVFQNWTKEKALDELKNGGFGFHRELTNIPDYIVNVNVEKIKKQVFAE